MARPAAAEGRLSTSAAGGRLRVLSVFGTRPEAIKMAPIVLSLAREPAVQSLVCITGQHRQLLDGALESFGIVPDFDLDLMQPGQELSSLCSRILSSLHEVLRKLEPDVVVVQGDTTSTFGAALAAAYAGIPVVHVEAGLRTHDPSAPFPEELNRRLIDQLAFFCFAPTQVAQRNLRWEGISSERIAVIGNPGIDALLRVREPARRRAGPTSRRRQLLVTCHRRESFGDTLRGICGAVREIALARPDLRVRWILHPNPDAGPVARQQLAGTPGVELIAPLAYGDMVREMLDAHLVLTDSGGIQEEAPELGRAVLVLRDATERVEGLRAGVARLVGTRPEAIVSETNRVLDDPAVHARMSQRMALYGDGHAAPRVTRWLLYLAGLSPQPPASWTEAPLACGAAAAAHAASA